MKSIREKLVANFMIIIFVTVCILEILLIQAIKQNYYNNLEDVITNQIRTSSEIYTKYYSDSTLNDNIINNVDTYWKQTSAQVQIIDLSGKVLMDSIGVVQGNLLQCGDVKQAVKGKKGKWVGKVEYDNEKIMAVSYPLISDNKIVGVLRFITSLREVNKDINKTIYVFISIGILVLIISGVLSIFMANLIVEPLNEITNIAEIMAQGNFKVRSKKKHDDEFGKLSNTLNYMADEIIKKDQLKNEFISSISHELRTPLTSIKGWAITLNDGEFNDKELLYDGLSIIEKESDRLTIMVEELLDFSKFVSGRINLKKENVDISQLMEHLRKQIMPRVFRENINFNISYDSNLPIIISDENKLKQLFLNIIDNAINFTPTKGSIDFTAIYDEGNIVFRVRDSGCGISAEELSRVKEKFYKGKTSKSKNGIGLSICDEIVKLMKGTLEIESRLGEGTEIIITLPALIKCSQDGDKN